MTTISLSSASTAEKLRATITTTADPTGDNIEWQLTTPGAQPSSLAWVVGAWDSGGYGGGSAVAVSPLVVDVLGGGQGRYQVWVRWTVGDETPERIAGTLQIA